MTGMYSRFSRPFFVTELPGLWEFWPPNESSVVACSFCPQCQPAAVTTSAELCCVLYSRKAAVADALLVMVWRLVAVRFLPEELRGWCTQVVGYKTENVSLFKWVINPIKPKWHVHERRTCNVSPKGNTVGMSFTFFMYWAEFCWVGLNTEEESRWTDALLEATWTICIRYNC